MPTKIIFLSIIVLLSMGFIRKNKNFSSHKVFVYQKDTPQIDSSFLKTNDSIQIVPKEDTVFYIIGTASYYHDKFVGRKTSTGQIFSQDKYTAAHRTIPLGTYVNITNLNNKKNVKVLINDRMGKSRHEIDVTSRVAKELGFYIKGWTKVKIDIINSKNKK